jgi:hypothetical protein
LSPLPAAAVHPDRRRRLTQIDAPYPVPDGRTEITMIQVAEELTILTGGDLEDL